MKLRFRLWHLFAVTAVVALAVWVPKHLGFAVVYFHQDRSWLVDIRWDNRQLVKFHRGM